MYLALTILLNVLAAIALLVMVPVTMGAAWDPTRQVDAWLDDARTAWGRGERATAVRLASRAMWWSERGRYTPRRRAASLAALDLLAELAGPLPAEAARLRAALAGGADRVDPEIVGAARARLDRWAAEVADTRP